MLHWEKIMTRNGKMEKRAIKTACGRYRIIHYHSADDSLFELLNMLKKDKHGHHESLGMFKTKGGAQSEATTLDHQRRGYSG